MDLTEVIRTIVACERVDGQIKAVAFRSVYKAKEALMEETIHPHRA